MSDVPEYFVAIGHLDVERLSASLSTLASDENLNALTQVTAIDLAKKEALREGPGRNRNFVRVFIETDGSSMMPPRAALIWDAADDPDPAFAAWKACRPKPAPADSSQRGMW